MSYGLRRIPRNDKWKVFPKLLIDKNATMTATPNDTVTKVFEMEAAIKRENGLAPKALLFARQGGNGSNGGNGGKAGKGGRSPKRDRRDDRKDNKGDKVKDFRKCFHCQWRGHTTKICFSKQRRDPPMAADTAATASTEATSTLTMSIKNY
jgi:hypothetical protein